MGIRAFGDKNRITVGLRPVRIVTAGDDGKPAPGGDADGDGSDIDGPDGVEQRSVNVAPGFIDTATIGDGNSSGTSGDAPFGYTKSGRRRNRAIGSNRNSGRAASGNTSQTTDDIAGYLASAHLLAANLLKMPQFKLSDDESKKLAEATIRVTQLYDLGIGTEEQRAWVNLAMVAGSIYIPKVFDGPKNRTPVVPSKANGKVEQVSEPLPEWMNLKSYVLETKENGRKSAANNSQ